MLSAIGIQTSIKHVGADALVHPEARFAAVLAKMLLARFARCRVEISRSLNDFRLTSWRFVRLIKLASRAVTETI